jgi:hypothetical protein
MAAASADPRAIDRRRIRRGGDENVADDAPTPQAGIAARLAIVDLKGLPNPKDVLGDLRLLLEPHQVVV